MNARRQFPMFYLSSQRSPSFHTCHTKVWAAAPSSVCFESTIQVTWCHKSLVRGSILWTSKYESHVFTNSRFDVISRAQCNNLIFHDQGSRRHDASRFEFSMYSVALECEGFYLPSCRYDEMSRMYSVIEYSSSRVEVMSLSTTSSARSMWLNCVRKWFVVCVEYPFMCGQGLLFCVRLWHRARFIEKWVHTRSSSWCLQFYDCAWLSHREPRCKPKILSRQSMALRLVWSVY